MVPTVNIPVGCSVLTAQIIRRNRLFWGYCLKTEMGLRGVCDYQSATSNQSVSPIKWPYSTTFKFIFAVTAYCNWIDGHILFILHFTSCVNLSMKHQCNITVILSGWPRSLMIMNCAVSSAIITLDSVPLQYQKAGGWNMGKIFVSLGLLQSIFSVPFNANTESYPSVLLVEKW